MTPPDLTDLAFFVRGPHEIFPTISEELHVGRINAPEMIAQTPTCGCFSFRWAATAWNSFSKRISDLGKRILSPLTKTPPPEIPEHEEKLKIENIESLERDTTDPCFIHDFIKGFLRSSTQLSHRLSINNKKATRQNVCALLEQSKMTIDLKSGNPTLRDPRVALQYLLGATLFTFDFDGVRNALKTAGCSEDRLLVIPNKDKNKKVDVVCNGSKTSIVIHLEFTKVEVDPKTSAFKDRYLVKQTLTIVPPLPGADEPCTIRTKTHPAKKIWF